jgi:hypothetical protein
MSTVAKGADYLQYLKWVDVNNAHLLFFVKYIFFFI